MGVSSQMREQATPLAVVTVFVSCVDLILIVYVHITVFKDLQQCTVCTLPLSVQALPADYALSYLALTRTTA
jgi:hypothetical protein